MYHTLKAYQVQHSLDNVKQNTSNNIMFLCGANKYSTCYNTKAAWIVACCVKGIY